jgi:hypothetical protein
MASESIAAPSAVDWFSPLLSDVFRHHLPAYLRPFDRGVFRRVCTKWRDALPLTDLALTYKWLSYDLPTFYAALKHSNSFVSQLYGGLPTELIAKIQRGEFSNLRSFSVNRNDLSDDTMQSITLALLSCQKLTSIDFSHNTLGEKACLSLSRLIYHSTTLETLVIPSYTVSKSPVKPIFDALERNSSIECLTIGFGELDGFSVRSLSTILTQNPKIRDLDLTDTLGANSAPFFEQLSKNTTVTSLSLYASRLDSTSVISALSEVLKNNTTLRSLRCEKCCIGPSLASSLTFNTTLTSLNLNHNPIGDAGVVALSSAIESPSCGIKILSLSSMACSLEGVSALSKALKINRSITSFQIGYLDGICAPLGGALASSPSLRHVTALFFELGESGIKDLANLLATNSLLTSLNLTYMSISHEAGLEFSYALGSNTTLQSLYISPKSSGTYDSMLGIALGLQKNKHLTSLTLHSDLDRQTRDALIQAIRSNTSLKNLHVAPAGFVESQCLAFFNALLETPASGLESIHMEHCNAKYSAARRFADVLRANSTKLRSISLINCFDIDSDMEDVAEGLAANEHVTYLNMSKGSLGSEGAKHLAAAMRLNTVLQDLKVNNHLITESGILAFKELSDARVHHRRGQVVSLSGNNPPPGLRDLTKFRL